MPNNNILLLQLAYISKKEEHAAAVQPGCIAETRDGNSEACELCDQAKIEESVVNCDKEADSRSKDTGWKDIKAGDHQTNSEEAMGLSSALIHNTAF